MTTVLAVGWPFSVGAFLCALAALALAGLLDVGILRRSDGDERMRGLARALRAGTLAFCAAEAKVLAVFVASVLLLLLTRAADAGDRFIAWGFVFGAVCSSLATWLALRAATAATVRTAEAARSSPTAALEVASSAGRVAGLGVVGLGLGGVCLLWFLCDDPGALFGFSLGTGVVALFARVGGGLFKQSAAGSLVVTQVGASVNGIAGMGADLFDSYVGSIIAAMAIGAASVKEAGLAPADHPGLLVLPLALAGGGLLATLFGRRLARRDDAQDFAAGPALLFVGAVLLLVALVDRSPLAILGRRDGGMSWWGTWTGLVCSILAGFGCGFALGRMRAHPVGAAGDFVSGLATGMASTALPALVIAAAILAAYSGGGLYGVALAAVGMVATLATSVGASASAPVAAGAGAIARTGVEDSSARQQGGALAAAGARSCAITQGNAVGAAALTALALAGCWRDAVGTRSLDLLDPNVIAGLLVGAMLPFFFTALLLFGAARATNRTEKDPANPWLVPAPPPWNEAGHLLGGPLPPDPAPFVAISTRGALQAMIAPGLLALAAPIVVGWLNAAALAGLLAGVLVSGVMLALFMTGAGRAFDPTKRFLEGGEDRGEQAASGGSGPRTGGADVALGAAGFEREKVGASLNELAGPALNVLIKLVAIVAVVCAK